MENGYLTPTSANTNELESEAQSVGPLSSDEKIAHNKRTSKQIAAMFRTRQAEGSTTLPYLKGIGSYTHAQLPSCKLHSPHDQQVEPPSVFVPLEGPQGAYPTGPRPFLPADVRAAYDALKEVIEEAEARDRDAVGPRSTSHAPPVAQMICPAQDANGKGEDTEMGGMGSDRSANVENEPLRRRSSGGGAMPPWGNRRPSAPQMEVAVNPTTPVVKGNTYDPSRDPRRRR